MRIVFMGTPQFAVPVLARLIKDGHEIAAVFTQPDKPAGRGYKLAPTPVKALALEHGLAVYQPVKLRDGAVAEQIRLLAPALAVVVAYGRILPAAVLEAPKLACINLHPSLLPRYRGPAPMQWALLNGDEITGVTSMFMAEEQDTGDIILQQEVPILPGETAPELSARLSVIGADCIARTVRLFESGCAPRTPQGTQGVTQAPMLTREMGRMDFTRPALELVHLVRGLAGWPSAYAFADGKMLKVHRAAPAAGFSGAPGEVLDTKRLVVGCGEGALELLEVQPEGKQRMEGGAYLRGARLAPGDRLASERT